MIGIDSQIIFLLVIALVVAMLIVILYLGREVRHKNEQITKLLSSSSVPLDAKTEMFNFYDEKGELKLSVRPEMVYYIESADNYAVIHYLNGNKLDKIFLRNTLKNIEWRFRDRNVVRCHRSYIINLNKVQMLRRDENEMLLDFGDDRVPPIPVSKGYVENVVNLFTQDTTN
jgi:DNA-binding LytR/AlgR family response regulator